MSELRPGESEGAEHLDPSSDTTRVGGLQLEPIAAQQLWPAWSAGRRELDADPV